MSKPDIILSTGAIIRHTRQPNGSQNADKVGVPDGAMTSAEWEEYCAILRAETGCIVIEPADRSK